MTQNSAISAHAFANSRARSVVEFILELNNAPMILRLFGQGQTVLPVSLDWDTLHAMFPNLPGTRQIFVATIDRIQTSCGTGVPLFEYQQQRDEMVQWAAQKEEAGIRIYQRQKNRVSIDGLTTPLGLES